MLSEEDVHVFVPIRLKALREEPESFGEAYEEAKQRSLESIAKLLQPCANGFVLGLFDGGLIGTVGFYRKEGMKTRHQGVIWGMYVVPEKRGKGFGKKLLLEAIARAGQMDGIEQIHLTVTTTKTIAREAYLSVGFSSFAVEKRALRVNGEYFDQEHMVLAL